VIVTEGIHDRFMAAMVEKMKTLKVDDARKAGTDIGPVVDDRQLAQDLEYIGIGQQEGAKLAYGGEALEKNADGAPRLLPAPCPVHRDHARHAHQPRRNLRPRGQRVARQELRRGPGLGQRHAPLAWPAALPPPASSTPRTSSGTRRPAW
jgi:hypothetical protein